MENLITKEIVEQYKNERLILKSITNPHDQAPNQFSYSDFIQWLQAKKLHDIELLLIKANPTT